MENEATVSNRETSTSTGGRQMKAKKRPSDDKDKEKLKKRIKNEMLNILARDLFEDKRNNSGRMPHRAIKKVIAIGKEMGVDTNSYKLLRMVKKIEAEVFPVASVPVNNTGGSSKLLPLTHNSKSQANASTEPETLPDTATKLTINSSNVASSALSETDPLPQTVTAKKKRGRPVGTTNAAKAQKGQSSGTTTADERQLETAKKNCIHEITRLYVEERKKVREKDDDHTALPKGFLKDLIAAQKEVFNLPPEHNIPTQTIYSRMRPGRSEQPAHRGTPSPVAALEQTVVDIAIQRGRDRQPLTPTEALCLINSLIDNTPLQEKLIIWKETHNQYQPDDKKGALGPGYWAGFMKRHGHLLVTKHD